MLCLAARSTPPSPTAVNKLFGGSGKVKIDPAYVGSLGTSSARITVEQQLTAQDHRHVCHQRQRLDAAAHCRAVSDQRQRLRRRHPR